MKYRILNSFLIISLICAGLLFTEKWKNTHSSTDHIIFNHIDLPTAKDQKHLDVTVNHILGIKHYQYHRNQHAISINYDHHVMKPEWIEKSLKASGIQTSGYQISHK
ncbi:hypothetical protein GMB86_02135 [Terrilactibacillus sp. BCM23-1]|uniref:HMA domain-containing protein n=1 Tax=Terrilactibacillus tamarindi TaxID=2599694 RepID=A0A6N8CLJ9_9BACI|nr:hypothetical protein [Terrilactibacillus tamarindi]MTT30812.1 hypothetical protein [Terrilactibacillus tamarindi]